ncbi:MAG: hypothetical protein OXD29_02810, partial [Roseovarius sp.]|nr:hypothetical protein [Roseovarius sp.]
LESLPNTKPGKRPFQVLKLPSQKEIQPMNMHWGTFNERNEVCGQSKHDDRRPSRIFTYPATSNPARIRHIAQ